MALPSREYYLKGSSKIDLIAYHNYMTKIAIILGADPATAADDMQEVLDFETQLANVRILVAIKIDSLMLIHSDFLCVLNCRHHYQKSNVTILVLCITN